MEVILVPAVNASVWRLTGSEETCKKDDHAIT